MGVRGGFGRHEQGLVSPTYVPTWRLWNSYHSTRNLTTNMDIWQARTIVPTLSTCVRLTALQDDELRHTLFSLPAWPAHRSTVMTSLLHSDKPSQSIIILLRRRPGHDRSRSKAIKRCSRPTTSIIYFIQAVLHEYCTGMTDEDHVSPDLPFTGLPG